MPPRRLRSPRVGSNSSSGSSANSSAGPLDHPAQLPGGEGRHPRRGCPSPAPHSSVPADLELFRGAGHHGHHKDVLRVQSHLFGVIALGHSAEHLLRGFAGGQVGDHVRVDRSHSTLPSPGQQLVIRGSVPPFFTRSRNSVASSMMVRSAAKSVSNTPSKPSRRRAADHLALHIGADGQAEHLAQGGADSRARSAPPRCLDGSRSGSQHLGRCCLSRRGRRWDRRRCTGRRRRRWSRPGPCQRRSRCAVAKPRSLAPMTPTSCSLAQTAVQRRHRIHLLLSRTICGATRRSGIGRCHLAVIAHPLSTPSSRQSFCSSQLPLRTQDRQSCSVVGEQQLQGLLAGIHAPWRCWCHTSMPSLTGYTQEATRLLAPFTSTTQMRQAPISLISFR